MITIEKPGTPAELVHFGVKGMHWGVHKREDSTSGQKSRAKQISPRKEKKAKQHEANARDMQAAIDRIHANPSSWRYAQRHRDSLVKDLEKKRNRELNDAKAVREGHLTSKQKKVLIGAGVTAGLLAAYGAYKLWDTGIGHQLLNSPHSYKKNADLARQGMSVDELLKDVVKPINPNYGDLGTKLNCRRCTFAYEMRRRGLDVKSTNTATAFGQHAGGMLNVLNPKTNDIVPANRFGLSRRIVKETSKGGGRLTDALAEGGLGKPVGDRYFSSMRSSDKAKAIFDTIAAHPGHARGELAVEWNFGGAHSMAWEKIDGVAHVFDNQTGKHYDLAKFTAELADNVNKAATTRLDDKALNGNYVGRWIRNAK